MNQISALFLTTSLSSLLKSVRPEALDAAAALIRAGKWGRKTDTVIHLALTDREGKFADWKVRGELGPDAVRLRKGREEHILRQVPRYTTSKDSLDPLLRLMPKLSITSTYQRNSRIQVSVTYGDGSDPFFADMKLPLFQDPEVEAAARCGAVLRMLATVAESTRRQKAETDRNRRLARKFPAASRKEAA